MAATKHGNRQTSSCERSNCWPRAQPDQAPADTEQRGAKDQSAVDTFSRREMKDPIEERLSHLPGGHHADRGNSNGPRKHEHKAWIPIAGDIEKATHASGIKHAGQRQAEAENHSRRKRGHDLQNAISHNPKNLIMVTVDMPAATKVTTATAERGESRARPTTPWPLVHPDPMREPNPTRKPATIRSISEDVIVASGQRP